MKTIGLLVGATVIAGGLVWAAQPNAPSGIVAHPTNVATAQDAPPVLQPAAPAPASVEPAPPPAEPVPLPHNFAIEQDGEYGYEPAVSETDRAAGTAVKPMVMIRFLGEAGGIRKISSNNNGVLMVMTCKTPCEIVRQIAYMDGQQIHQDTMRVAPGSLIGDIEDDIDNDQLKVYRSK